MAFGAIAMTSCSDDEYDVTGNPANLVYVNIANDYPAEMPKNTFAYTVYHTPVGPIVATTPENMVVTVMSTKNAPEDITVTLAVEPDLSVPGYAVLPENSGIKVSLAANTLTIPKGKNHSDGGVEVLVDYTNANWSVLTEKAYLVPVRITEATGAQASQEIGCAYVGVLTDVKDGMVNPAGGRPDGQMVEDMSGWSGTWSAPGAGRGGALNGKAFDNDQWSYAFFCANHADKVNEEVILDFDLGKKYTSTGIMLRYYFIYYTVKDAQLETSLDGVDYTVQGNLEWSDNGVERYFKFWAPMEFRYIRVTTHSFYGGTGEGTAFSDLIVYE